jgi:hypothetical protein
MMPQSAQKAEKPYKNPIDRIPLDRRSPGRSKGTPNTQTKLLKDALMLAAEVAGNKIEQDSGLVGYLVHVAMNKPDLFVPLLGKVLPLQVQGGASDGALEIRWLPPQEPPKVIEHEEE